MSWESLIALFSYILTSFQFLHIRIIRFRRGIKNCFFLLSVKKGGGSRPILKNLSENTQIFFPFLTKKLVFFFTIFDQKLSFLTIFFIKKGGSCPIQKNPYQKKLRWSKKGGGVSVFFTKSKKIQFLYASPYRQTLFLHSRGVPTNLLDV